MSEKQQKQQRQIHKTNTNINVLLAGSYLLSGVSKGTASMNGKQNTRCLCMLAAVGSMCFSMSARDMMTSRYIPFYDGFLVP